MLRIVNLLVPSQFEPSTNKCSIKFNSLFLAYIL